MKILPSFLLSLLLTTLLSFIAPVILIGGIFVVLGLLGYIPGLAILGQIGSSQVCTFLSVFGAGNPIEGLLVVGFACSTVGGLFDTFNFYCYQGYKSR